MAIRTLGLCIEDPDVDLKQDRIKSRAVSTNDVLCSCDVYDKLANKNPPFDFTFSYNL